MEKRPILAIMYDFDHTLSPRDMQEYGFIPDLGMEADVFWNKCLKAMKRNQMDQILAYMYMMLEEAKGKLIVNRNMLRALGKDVQLFDGVSDWFARVFADSLWARVLLDGRDAGAALRLLSAAEQAVPQEDADAPAAMSYIWEMAEIM